MSTLAPCFTSSVFRTALAAGLLAGLATMASAQAPVFQWQFDGTGTTSSSTVPASPTVALGLFGGNNIAADLHSATNTGPGGLGRAFDGTSATGHGANGPIARSIGFTNTAVDVLSSFTVTGWLRTPTAIANSPRVFSINANSGTDTGAANSISVLFNVNGINLDFRNSASVGSQLASAFTVNTNEWTFFAFTYTASGAGSNNVSLYRGLESGSIGSALAQWSDSTDSRPDLNGTGSLSSVMIGNRNSGSLDRAFDGLIDDIRLYGSALNVSQIEAVRLSGVSAIPEPSAFAALAGVAGLGMAGLRRRRRV